VLYVNPGSAGPRRFRLPISLGELTVDGAKVEARLITL
jgi:predicted phosphodiesterase